MQPACELTPVDSRPLSGAHLAVCHILRVYGRIQSESLGKRPKTSLRLSFQTRQRQQAVTNRCEGRLLRKRLEERRAPDLPGIGGLDFPSIEFSVHRVPRYPCRE